MRANPALLVILLATPAAMGSASVPPDSSPAPRAGEPEEQRLVEGLARIRALVDGQLELTASPSEVLGVELHNETAVALEKRRLESLLSGPGKTGTGRTRARNPIAAADGIGASLWQAQLDLDRARLSFLSLPEPERARLLELHGSRVQAADEDVRARAEAEESAKRALEERRRAEEETLRARTEKERLIAEERVRLLAAKEAQAVFESGLEALQAGTAALAEDTLKWRRRTTGLIEERKAGKRTPEAADAFYAEIRQSLRTARKEFRERLSRGARDLEIPGVPAPSPESGAVPANSENAALKSGLERTRARLSARTDSVLWERLEILNDRVENLNHDRLELYPVLSGQLRRALSRLTVDGWDQARNELLQVTLVTRYHVVLTTRTVAAGGTVRWMAGLRSLQLICLLGLFFWWRRKSAAWLSSLASAARSKPTPVFSLGPRLGLELMPFVTRVRRPAEWLLLAWIALRVAGPEISSLYEVRLLWMGMSWLLGGRIAINALDQLLSGRRKHHEEPGTGPLRLRSLRLVGWTVAAIGLLLGLTAEIVGKGTVYSWVVSLSFVLPAPIVLVLFRWWRPVTAAQLAGLKQRTAFVRWALQDAGTAGRFLRELAGTLYLMGRRISETFQAYSLRLNLTRRALAYLYRREASKRQAVFPSLGEVEPGVRALFDPATAPVELLEEPARSELERLRLAIGKPGVTALVGERGQGKSSLLRRIAALHEGTALVQVPRRDSGSLVEELRDLVEKPRRGRSTDGTAHAVLLLDDADRLVRLAPGGIDTFDAVMDFLRTTNGRSSSVLSFSPGIFRFVERARGRSTLFDRAVRVRPWTEELIAELILQRANAAGLELDFGGLLGMPGNTEQDDEEEESYLRDRYFRMLWDFSAGNPAVALHFFGASLGRGPGGEACVQLLPPPRPEEFESLPDSGAFVLRRLVELGESDPAELADTTRISERLVLDTLRHGEARRWVESTGGSYTVSWTWQRPLLQALARRHLVPAGGRG